MSATAPFNIDAELDAYEAAQEEAPVAETPAAEAAPGATPLVAVPDAGAAEDPYAALLAHEAIPPSLRGKPAPEIFRSLLDERRYLSTAANQAGEAKNAAELRAQIAEGIARTAAAWQQAPSAPAEVSDMDLLSAPAEHFKRMVEEAMRPLRDELDGLRKDSTFSKMEAARTSAMTAAGIHDPQLARQIAGPIAGFLSANGKDGTNPASWTEGLEWYKASAAALAPKTTVAAAPAPPAGSAVSRAGVTAKAQLPPKEQKMFDALMQQQNPALVAGNKFYDAALADQIREHNRSKV